MATLPVSFCFDTQKMMMDVQLTPVKNVSIDRYESKRRCDDALDRVQYFLATA